MEAPAFSRDSYSLRVCPGLDADVLVPPPAGTPPFTYQWTRGGATLDGRFRSTVDSGGVRLTVTAAQVGDSGLYTLQASNAAGKDTTRVSLEVAPEETQTGDDPPTFLRRLQDLTVKVGTRTRFLVEIISSTECKVTWYRNERRLLEAERIALVRDGNFFCADLASVTVDDAGRWTCTAENLGGRASCSAHLNVLVPKAYKRPEFVEELRAILTEQGTVSLECKVVGVPTPVLRWFKDSREIKAGDVFALTANADDPTSLGTYTCEAINCMGRAYSSSKVHVIGRKDGDETPISRGISADPPPIFTKELEDHFIKICDPLTLSCHIVVPPWPRSVVWYNKEGKIEQSTKYHILEDGVGGYMVEVSPAEWADEGEWKCVATSAGGRVGITTCNVAMDVPKNYRKPRFMENLQAVLTEEGLVSFECKVVGFPTPVLSWFKDGQELKPGDVYQLTGTNSLGSYCCIARNCMGQASSSAELTVEDIQNQLNEEEKLQLFSKNQAPKFLQGLKSVEAKIDEPFRFTVKVAIPPEPTVLWYRDDQPVDESPRCNLGKEDRGFFYLDIKNLELMDQTEWKCVAMNDFGHSVTSCFLKLIIPRHFKKPRFLENLQAILSDEGAVNLECKVIGVPQPVLKWYKDGEELKPGDIHRIISGQDGTCCLGTYTCEAQNCMGIAASSASLLGFEDTVNAKKKKSEEILQRNLSLSTIHEERTSQMYDTPVADVTLDDKGEISFSFDGKEVSVSLYETPDLTEEEALQIVEMYADQLSENVTEHNVIELPPLRFVKETSTSGNLLMEAIIIDVSPDYFVSPEEDLRTEADIEDISIADENGNAQLSFDQDVGEDYIEKTMALLSDEKSDLPSKVRRRKSDSQKSGDDFYSLSKEQSLSEEKKDDETQILSESASFASAKSTGKQKSKPSQDDDLGTQESSDVTKTVLFRDEHPITFDKDKILLDVVMKESVNSVLEKSDSSNLELQSPEEVNEHITVTGTLLSKIINDIQVLERDIILKSQLLSSAAVASKSLEIINSLITPLSGIHSIVDTLKESICESSKPHITLFHNLPIYLKEFHKALTMVEKCIDVGSDKTLIQNTCLTFINSSGADISSVIQQIGNIVSNKSIISDKNLSSEIQFLLTDVQSILQTSKSTALAKSVLTVDNKKQEFSFDLQHRNDTQKALYDLKIPLKSLLNIVDNAMSGNDLNSMEINNAEVILFNMAASIQDLQTSLEHIEFLSVEESNSTLQKLNTNIIETVMGSVLKLRNSFESLSMQKETTNNKEQLMRLLGTVKLNLNEISSHIENIENDIGQFDVLYGDNKLELLQKMAHTLITLENSLPVLKSFPNVQDTLTTFHKNLTKTLEHVIETNDSNKYSTLVYICDVVNRINISIKNLESDKLLSFASIANNLSVIEELLRNNSIDQSTNEDLLKIIGQYFVDIQNIITYVDDESIKVESERVENIACHSLHQDSANFVMHQIEQAVAVISNISLETAANLNSIFPVLQNTCPILEELKYTVASFKQDTNKEDSHASDISECAIVQSFGKSLQELSENLTVLNNLLLEATEDVDIKSDVRTVFAQPLFELYTALQTLQDNIISQHESLSSLNISKKVAETTQELHDFVVLVQEQHEFENGEEISTLDDISGIKTTADSVLSDNLMVPTIQEATVKEAPNIIANESKLEISQVLQQLHNDIVDIQKFDILEALNSLSEMKEYSELKFATELIEELQHKIIGILSPLLMESLSSVSNIDIENCNYETIREPLLKLQSHLSVIDVNNISVYEEVLHIPSDKIHSIVKSISNLKLHLDKCLLSLQETSSVQPELQPNYIIEKLCKELMSCLKDALQKDNESIISMDDFRDLEGSINEFLQGLRTDLNISSSTRKTAFENFYKQIMSLQDKVIKFVCSDVSVLDNPIMSITNNIAITITDLQPYNVIDVSEDLEMYDKPLHSIATVTDIINTNNLFEEKVIYIKDLVLQAPASDVLILEDFFNSFKNSFNILKALISQNPSHKKVIRLFQEYFKLQTDLEDFRKKLSYLNLSSPVQLHLSDFLMESEASLNKVKASLLKISSFLANTLYTKPLSKIESIKESLPTYLAQQDNIAHLENLLTSFLSFLNDVYPHLQNIEDIVVYELNTGVSTNTNMDDQIMFDCIESFMLLLKAEIDKCKSDRRVNLNKILKCIQNHQDYKTAIGSGKKMIVLKCLSECSDLIQILIDTENKNVTLLDIQDFSLNFVLKELESNLQLLNEEVCNFNNSSNVETYNSTQINKAIDAFLQNPILKKISLFENENISFDDTNILQVRTLVDEIKLTCNNLREIVHNIPEDYDKISERLNEMLYFLNKISSKQALSHEHAIREHKTESLLKHVDQYIEITEIIEEISAIVNLGNIKEAKEMAQELRETLMTSDVQCTCSENLNYGIVNESQEKLVERLQKSLTNIREQAIEKTDELSTFDKDVKQSLVEVITRLSDDLNIITGSGMTNQIINISELSVTEKTGDNYEANNEGLEVIVKSEIEDNDNLVPIKSEIYSIENEFESHEKIDTEAIDEIQNSFNLLKEEHENMITIDDASNETSETVNKNLEEHSKASASFSANGECDVKDTSNLTKQIEHNTDIVLNQLEHTITSMSSIDVEEMPTTLKGICPIFQNICPVLEALKIKIASTQQSAERVESQITEIHDDLVLQEICKPLSELQEHISVLNNFLLDSIKTTVDSECAQTLSVIAKPVHELYNAYETLQENIISQYESMSPLYNSVNVISTTQILQSCVLLVEDKREIETVDEISTLEDISCIKTTADSVCSDELANALQLEVTIEQNNAFMEEEHIIKDNVSDSIKNENLDNNEKVNSSLNEIEFPSIIHDTASTQIIKIEKDVNQHFISGSTTYLQSNQKESHEYVHEETQAEALSRSEITAEESNTEKITCMDITECSEKLLKDSEYPDVASNLTHNQFMNSDIPTTSISINEHKGNTDIVENVTVEINVNQDKKEIMKPQENDKVPDNNCESTIKLDILRKHDVNIVTNNEEIIFKMEAIFSDLQDNIMIATTNVIEKPDILQNLLDEFQMQIIQLKSSVTGSTNESFNDAVDDLECSVRSVQLLVSENSPLLHIMEATSTLQVLINGIKENIMSTGTTMEAKTDSAILKDCLEDTENTLILLDKIHKKEDQSEVINIINDLNYVKETVKAIKQHFSSNQDIVIEKAVDILQDLENIENKLFAIENDVDSINQMETTTRDNILTAVHSVYSNISNMRGTISCIQKRYIHENYGKPADNLLKCIKFINEINTKDTKHDWTELSKYLRRVLNHFEDIKFYINLDKTARLPSDTSITVVVLKELQTLFNNIVLANIRDAQIPLENEANTLVQKIDEIICCLQNQSILQVKDKIPVFKETSVQIFTFMQELNYFYETSAKNKIKNGDDDIENNSQTEILNILENPTISTENSSIPFDTKCDESLSLDKKLLTENVQQVIENLIEEAIHKLILSEDEISATEAPKEDEDVSCPEMSLYESASKSHIEVLESKSHVLDIAAESCVEARRDLKDIPEQKELVCLESFSEDRNDHNIEKQEIIHREIDAVPEFTGQNNDLVQHQDDNEKSYNDNSDQIAINQSIEIIEGSSHIDKEKGDLSEISTGLVCESNVSIETKERKDAVMPKEDEIVQDVHQLVSLPDLDKESHIDTLSSNSERESTHVEDTGNCEIGDTYLENILEAQESKSNATVLDDGNDHTSQSIIMEPSTTTVIVDNNTDNESIEIIEVSSQIDKEKGDLSKISTGLVCESNVSIETKERKDAIMPKEAEIVQDVHQLVSLPDLDKESHIDTLSSNSERESTHVEDTGNCEIGDTYLENILEAQESKSNATVLDDGNDHTSQSIIMEPSTTTVIVDNNTDNESIEIIEVSSQIDKEKGDLSKISTGLVCESNVSIETKERKDAIMPKEDEIVQDMHHLVSLPDLDKESHIDTLSSNSERESTHGEDTGNCEIGDTYLENILEAQESKSNATVLDDGNDHTSQSNIMEPSTTTVIVDNNTDNESKEIIEVSSQIDKEKGDLSKISTGLVCGSNVSIETKERKDAVIPKEDEIVQDAHQLVSLLDLDKESHIDILTSNSERESTHGEDTGNCEIGDTYLENILEAQESKSNATVLDDGNDHSSQSNIMEPSTTTVIVDNNTDNESIEIIEVSSQIDKEKGDLSKISTGLVCESNVSIETKERKDAVIPKEDERVQDVHQLVSLPDLDKESYIDTLLSNSERESTHGEDTGNCEIGDTYLENILKVQECKSKVMVLDDGTDHNSQSNIMESSTTSVIVDKNTVVDTVEVRNKSPEVSESSVDVVQENIDNNRPVEKENKDKIVTSSMCEPNQTIQTKIEQDDTILEPSENCENINLIKEVSQSNKCELNDEGVTSDLNEGNDFCNKRQENVNKTESKDSEQNNLLTSVECVNLSEKEINTVPDNRNEDDNKCDKLTDLTVFKTRNDLPKEIENTEDPKQNYDKPEANTLIAIENLNSDEQKENKNGSCLQNVNENNFGIKFTKEESHSSTKEFHDFSSFEQDDVHENTEDNNKKRHIIQNDETNEKIEIQNVKKDSVGNIKNQTCAISEDGSEIMKSNNLSEEINHPTVTEEQNYIEVEDKQITADSDLTIISAENEPDVKSNIGIHLINEDLLSDGDTLQSQIENEKNNEVEQIKTYQTVNEHRNLEEAYDKNQQDSNQEIEQILSENTENLNFSKYVTETQMTTQENEAVQESFLDTEIAEEQKQLSSTNEHCVSELYKHENEQHSSEKREEQITEENIKVQTCQKADEEILSADMDQCMLVKKSDNEDTIIENPNLMASNGIIYDNKELENVINQDKIADVIISKDSQNITASTLNEIELDVVETEQACLKNVSDHDSTVMLSTNIDNAMVNTIETAKDVLIKETQCINTENNNLTPSDVTIHVLSETASSVVSDENTEMKDIQSDLSIRNASLSQEDSAIDELQATEKLNMDSKINRDLIITSLELDSANIIATVTEGTELVTSVSNLKLQGEILDSHKNEIESKMKNETFNIEVEENKNIRDVLLTDEKLNRQSVKSNNETKDYQIEIKPEKLNNIEIKQKKENKIKESLQKEDVIDDVSRVSKAKYVLESNNKPSNENKRTDNQEIVATYQDSISSKMQEITDNESNKYNIHVKNKPHFTDPHTTESLINLPRPPGYIQKNHILENLSEPEQNKYNIHKNIYYKAQSLILDRELKSPGGNISDFNITSKDQVEAKHKTKAFSETRSYCSDKRSSLSRDLKKKPVLSTYLTNRTAVEGSRVKLTCSVLSSAEPVVKWYKNGILLEDKHKYKLKFSDGLITMELLNALPSDSGDYSCTIEDENGSVTTSAKLKVYPSFEASPIPPTFTRSIRDVYHRAENELVLECRIRGQPLPTISWFKDNIPLICGNNRYEASYLADGLCRLCINSPTVEDSGTYTCKAESSMWTDQISHYVHFTGVEDRGVSRLSSIDRRQIYDTRRPHFTNVLTDYKVIKGGTIGLQVEIGGAPTRVEWLREGSSVTDIDKNAQTFVDHGTYTLALSDVTEKHSGLYTCRAWSTQGNVDMNADITVVQPYEIDGKPPVIISRPAKDLLISVGEDINITFRVQGEPKPKVFFMKGIKDITNSQRVCKMTSDDYVKFTLKRSVISDAGTYCILAKNCYGCDRAFVTVVVRQRASSDNLISDWTYPVDDTAIIAADKNYKTVPGRIPGEPSAVDGGNNWVALAWPKPVPPTGTPVLAYRVESWLLGKDGGARWVEMGITPRNTFDVFNLKQGGEYHFRVTPRNRYGWGEPVQTSTPIGVGISGDTPEFIEVLPGLLKVLVGETANLTCSFKGKPNPDIIWMKNGHEIEEFDRIKILQSGNVCSLSIKDVVIEDEGRYSCEATNIHGRASTYSRMTIITDRQIWEADAKLKRERSSEAIGDYPPQFTMRLRDRRVQATYPVRLTCQVVGSPTPTVTWYKDGQEVAFDRRKVQYQEEHFHTLEIAPTNLDDGGVYEALARNSSGAISCRCSLVVDKGIRAYVAPEFCCGLDPLYRLNEGEELRISAIVEAYPSVGVTWYRDGVRLRPSRRAVMTLNRDGEIELALASVTPRDAGVYTCTASNEVGQASTSGKVEIITEPISEDKRRIPTVVCSDVPYSKEPMFIKKPRSTEAQEGDTVIIECEVIGDPAPDVYWLRDFLKPEYYRDAKHFKQVSAGPLYRFEIPHAKLDYTGAYSIVARNVHGEAKAIISLQIFAKDLRSSDETHNVRYGRVEVLPRFERQLKDLLCYDGDAVEFECKVSGNPEPDIRWLHYKEVLPDCPDFESTYDSGTARLKIKQVAAEDEGTYTCEASNNLGKATSTACLVVYPPGEPNTLSQRLHRPAAFASGASTPRSTPRTTPARSMSRTPARSVTSDTARARSPVKESAPKFYTYPFNRVVEEGGSAVLQCAVGGQPPPWTTWDKDGVIITPSSRISIKEKDDMLRILQIDEVQIEDVGLYRVTLENEFGRAEAAARLEVLARGGKFHARAASASPVRVTRGRRTPSLPRQD